MGIARGFWASRAVSIPLSLLVFALAHGCAIPPAARRLGAHVKRDAKLAHAENPTEATERLVIGTQAMGGWLGPPEAPVKLEDFKRDVADLKLASSPVGWLGKILIFLAGLGGVVGAAYGSNYVLAARRLLGVLTGGIEQAGHEDTKKAVERGSKGRIGLFEVNRYSGLIDTTAMLGRWVARAEKGVKA